jgi:hypothetical protein
MLAYLKKLLTRTPKQYTFCYCPECRNELCGSRGVLDETSYVKHFDDHTVHYRCKKCGLETRWFFDAPVPFMLNIVDEDDKWRKVPSWQWKCDWLKCDWGTGLAGADRCPGYPTDKNCLEFTTEYSDYNGDK